jgi:hypothetical protein
MRVVSALHCMSTLGLCNFSVLLWMAFILLGKKKWTICSHPAPIFEAALSLEMCAEHEKCLHGMNLFEWKVCNDTVNHLFAVGSSVVDFRTRCDELQVNLRLMILRNSQCGLLMIYFVSEDA